MKKHIRTFVFCLALIVALFYIFNLIKQIKDYRDKEINDNLNIVENYLENKYLESFYIYDYAIYDGFRAHVSSVELQVDFDVVIPEDEEKSICDYYLENVLISEATNLIEEELNANNYNEFKVFFYGFNIPPLDLNQHLYSQYYLRLNRPPTLLDLKNEVKFSEVKIEFSKGITNVATIVDVIEKLNIPIENLSIK